MSRVAMSEATAGKVAAAGASLVEGDTAGAAGHLRAAASSTLTRALSPVGCPPRVRAKRAAKRLDTLAGKVIYIVDSRFDDSTALLRQVERWCREHLPETEIRFTSLRGSYWRDNSELFAELSREGDAAIVGVGHCSTCAPGVTAHAIQLEVEFGIPTAALHTDRFIRVVRSTAKVKGLAEAPQVYVPQPVMGKSEEELWAYVTGADPHTGRPVMEEVIEALTVDPAPPREERASSQAAPRFAGAASEDELHALFLRNRWTDGLPIVLPTEERVAAMLACTSRKSEEIVGRMQATKNRGLWEYDVEKVAVNAVMAGAPPEAFPVILALASAGVSARSSSSSSAAMMVVVNGPIRAEIGMNCGIGALGPFNHVNATIGRAYGLLSQNLQGGSVPGETYMGSLGNGFGFTNLTFAENEERSPWEPLHVQHGFAAEDSVVSIFSGCRSAGFSLGLRAEHWREHVRNLLTAVDCVAAPALVLDPIVARQFVERGGFDTKEKLIDFLFESATMEAQAYWDLQLVQNYIYPETESGLGDHPARIDAAPGEMVHMFRRQGINVIVTGGETNGYWQMIGASRAASVRIDDWR